MSRTVSLTLREAMNAQETGEVLVVLLTITHPDYATPLRISSDPTTLLSEAPLQYGTVSRGETYLFAPFSTSLPDDMDERAPTARFVLENISRDLVELVRSVSTPAKATIEVVLASSPDSVEIEYPEFDVKNASYNANVMTLELSIDALTDEPYPSGTFSPASFPGLF
ncbi:DUF1833 family protein [Pseudaminobacter sp. NGMCC 1.201702]|uniref:DUF1833 family protein n=1 Tax=Pseudaminobacter sp. NGMCC 1.201702 TaxID=3391825 RepID=UPI0039EFE187